MAVKSVRYLLIFTLAWSLTECPGKVSAPGEPSFDEISSVGIEDLATLSLRYREQLDERIHASALLCSDLVAAESMLISTFGGRLPAGQADWPASRALSLQQLMSFQP
jgi:hypothetical protein